MRDGRTPSPRSAVRISAGSILPRISRDPLAAFAEIGARARGAVARLDLGPLRSYLVTSPEHVQHVLVDNADNYQREGMLWRPARQIIGDGLGGDGPRWAASRQVLQPFYGAKRMAEAVPAMSAVIDEVVAGWADRARDGRPIDAVDAMTSVVNRVAATVFFSDRISPAAADRLGRAIVEAFHAQGPRMFLPFVPQSVPLPGWRRFRRANGVIDEIVAELIRRSRADAAAPIGRDGADAEDVLSVLRQARDPTGREWDDARIHDDVVAVLAAGTETTATTLAWLWVVLDRHPEVVDRLRREAARPLTDGGPTDRPYTRMVLHELVRLYPVGWVIPRQAVRADSIDGVPIEAGRTVFVCPYLTHRDDRLWPDPERFDPERFAPGRARERHRFAYVPFGAGGHQCLGRQLYMIEAALILGAVLNRYRPEVIGGTARITPRAGLTLTPRQPVPLRLRPV